MFRFIDLEDEAPQPQAIPQPLAGKLGAEEAEVAGPWAGKPGEFGDKWQAQNAIDAINKAGASLIGVKNANPNDLKLLKNFYGNPENNAVANQYDLNTNLFLRYLSGRGAEGLELGKKQAQQLFQSIQEQSKNLAGPKGNEIRERIRTTYGKGHLDRISKGHIPVYLGGAKDAPAPIPGTLAGYDQLENSIGSYWAVPDGKGGYTIDETYNFSYAPGSKENRRSEAEQQQWTKTMLKSWNPANVGRGIVMAGNGKPYRYKIIIDSKGRATVVPVR